MQLSRKKVLATVGGAVAAVGIATAAPAMAVSYATLTYDAAGTTHIAGQVNADATLGPAQLKVRFDVDSGNFDQGTLPLPPTQVEFPVLGGLSRLRATVNFIQAAPITGTFTSAATNTVKANAKYTIKLTNVSAKGLFGVYLPLFVGNSCQTVSPVSLNFATPAGQNFDILNGGTLTSKYTIGQFSGCNVLVIPGIGSVLVNVLVPNSNNTASITLKNGQFS